ncbi:coiled-coil domain-containing protein 160 [Pelodytes ibericus]
MEGEKKHWVEELFSPNFSAEDFFHLTFEPDQLPSEKLAERRAKAVEKIYHASLQKSRQEEKENRRKSFSRLIVQDYELHVPEKNIKHKQSTPDQQATCGLCGKSSTNPSSTANNDCIWDGNELSILRQEMSKNQSIETHLKIQLDACNLEIAELKAKYSKTLQKLDNMKSLFATVKRENECKTILINVMQKDLPKKDAAILALKKDLHGKCVQISSVNKHLNKARGDFQELQLKNKDLKQEIMTLKQQQELTNAALIEKLRLEHNVEINNLQREIKVIKEEKNSDKMQHARDVIALDLLRKHFSSLSMNQSPNYVQLNVPPH